ncbi:MAG TPA: amidohydrolase family protein [Paludibacter sp.]
MRTTLVIIVLFLSVFCKCLGQVDSTNLKVHAPERTKVIDVHIHAPLCPGDVEGSSMQTVKIELVREMDSLNIVFGVLNGLPEFFEPWNKAAPGRFLNYILFPCVDGKTPNFARDCFPGGKSFPDITWLENEIKKGKIHGFGEFVPEYIGMNPNDKTLEPYWSLAEKYDIPVAIHMGIGPPNAAYPSNPCPYKSPNFRVSAGNPLLLEEVLLKHKKLRVWVMHAGYPMLNEMIYILYAHPNVNVDTGVLQWAIPRKEYYSYLQRLVDAGYSDRIMFGSDGNPGEGIKAIFEANFLTEQQRQDILYNNAVRFLKLRLKEN